MFVALVFFRLLLFLGIISNVFVMILFLRSQVSAREWT